jgi:Pyruvate/2-oxoacid:ferredoxin oxidoreductase gamma subunit
VRKEIVLAGTGGQGIQSFGSLLSKILDSKGHMVSLSFNYGPEARGGKSFGNIVIKDSPDDWPEILKIDILVAMSQDGYESCLDKTDSNSIIIYDIEMVKPVSSSGKYYAIPALKTAALIGSTISVNMVMLGAMAAITGLCSLEDFSHALNGNSASPDKRLKFITEGYKLGKLQPVTC